MITVDMTSSKENEYEEKKKNKRQVDLICLFVFK